MYICAEVSCSYDYYTGKKELTSNVHLHAGFVKTDAMCAFNQLNLRPILMVKQLHTAAILAFKYCFKIQALFTFCLQAL